MHQHDLKVLDRILERGLCHGGGDGKTTFCAEQAVAVLCGLPVTDRPDECVTPAVSAFGRRLNDSRGWKDEKVRAAGMRDFLIAQIGSKGVVDGPEFAKRIALKTIQRILPIWLRHGKIDEALVTACERATTLDEGRLAAIAARDDAREKRRAAAAAAYAAAAYAYAAAYAAAYAYAYAAAYAAAAAAAYDAADDAAAAAAAAAAADAADAADAAADAANKIRAQTLPLSASLAVEVLRELKSPGCELLQ